MLSSVQAADGAAVNDGYLEKNKPFTSVPLSNSASLTSHVITSRLTWSANERVKPFGTGADKYLDRPLMQD